MTYLCLKRQTVKKDNYLLTAIRKEDIQKIRKWRNEQMDILRQDKPISYEDQEIYYLKSLVPNFSEKHPENILLSFLEDNKLIGYGGLVHINWETNSAEVSFLLETKRTWSGNLRSQFWWVDRQCILPIHYNSFVKVLIIDFEMHSLLSLFRWD